MFIKNSYSTRKWPKSFSRRSEAVCDFVGQCNWCCSKFYNSAQRGEQRFIWFAHRRRVCIKHVPVSRDRHISVDLTLTLVLCIPCPVVQIEGIATLPGFKFYYSTANTVTQFHTSFLTGVKSNWATDDLKSHWFPEQQFAGSAHYYGNCK